MKDIGLFLNYFQTNLDCVIILGNCRGLSAKEAGPSLLTWSLPTWWPNGRMGLVHGGEPVVDRPTWRW